MNNFGRHSRREIAMSRPLASHKNPAQPRPDGVPHPPLFAAAGRFSQRVRADSLLSFHYGIY